MFVNQIKEQFEQVIRGIDNNKTFFDVKDFLWVTKVEAYWPSIRQELDRLLTCVNLLPGFEEIQAEQSDLSKDKRWKIFPLYVYGQRMEANQRRCPVTTQAIQTIPGLRAAMFSVLQGKKELPSHHGPFAGVLRYHLGVKVPGEKQCGITVGGDTAYWQEGKSLIFDDSHLHNAWNHSDEDRVVLFVDFTRPLSGSLATINDQFISAISKSDFIHQAATQWTKWETVHGEELDKILCNS